MKKTLIITSFLVTLISLFCAFKNEPKTEPVKVFIAWPNTKSLPHFEWKKNSQKPIGVEPEFIEEIMKRAKVDFEYVSDYNYTKNGDSRIDVLTDGKADISIRGITITKERKKKVLFSKTYYVDGLGIMVTKGSKIESIDDLKNKKVFAHNYTTAYKWISKNLQNSNLITYKKEQGKYIEPEQLLREGKIDAYIIDYSYLAQSARTNTDLKVLNVKLTSEKLGIAVNKNRKDLLKKINKAISELKKEGGLEKLASKIENSLTTSSK